MNIDDNQLELLDDKGEVKSDVNLPDAEHLKEVATKIREIFEEGKKECLVVVLNCMNKEIVTECREGADM